MTITLTLTDDQIDALATVVAERMRGTTTPSPRPHFYTVPEVAKALRISTKTVRRRIDAGIIPRVPAVAAVRIPAAWLDQQTQA